MVLDPRQFGKIFNEKFKLIQFNESRPGRHWLRSMWIILVVSLFCTTASLALAGSIYYVSPTGNDSNSGSSADPWRSIQKCANTIIAGDTCVLKDGSYVGDINWSRSGTSDNTMTVLSENSRKATIVGRMSITGSYVEVKDLKFILPDGYQYGVHVTGSYNQVVSCFVTTESTSLGLNNVAINISGSNNLTEGNYVEKTCFGYSLYGTNNTFQNNEATGLKLNGSCGDVDYMRFFGTNHIIKNNNFHSINMNEVGTAAHVDCFQSFDNPGSQYAIANIVVEGNYCSDAHEGMMIEGKIYKQSSNLTIRNNIFKKCSGWCACVTDIANVFFYNNTCDTTGGYHGIWCRGDTNVASCEFKNNLVYGTGSFYGVMETAILIDGTAQAPGKNNLLFKPGTTITGFANDIINQDPLFENPGTGDYRLKATSPAVNMGLAITGWESPTDRIGTRRPQDLNWDIGAHEYVGVIVPWPQNLKTIE